MVKSKMCWVAGREAELFVDEAEMDMDFSKWLKKVVRSGHFYTMLSQIHLTLIPSLYFHHLKIYN